MAKVKTLFLKIYNNLLLFYSVMFLLTALLGFSYVYTKGMVLVSQSGDNYTQHFKAFVYYSDFIKGILKRLVFERRLVIPHWDFGIGEGYDILTTFNYYGMGDPINIPFILFPRKIISIAFSLGNILRLYLMGLGVIHYCRVSLLKTDNAAYVAGALSYAFCGFALSDVRGHTIFLTALAALPFLFAGIESYLKEKRRLCLILTVCVLGLYNFYWLYILGIMGALYCIIRVVFSREIMLFDKIKAFGGLLLCVLLGLLMAGVIFVPNLNIYINNPKNAIVFKNPFLYDIFYYLNLIPSFITYGGAGQCVTAVMLPAVILFFLHKKGMGFFKIFTVACYVMLLFPFFGSMFNGFTHSILRWVFLVAFVNSVIIVICWDEFVNIKASDAKLPVIILLGIFLFCAFISFDQNELTYEGFVIAFLVLLGVVVINALSVKEKRTIAGVFICLMVVLNTLLIFHKQYSFKYENNKGLKLAEDLSTDLYKCEADVIKELASIDGVEDKLYRYSGETSINPGMLSGVSSTSFYLSALNPYDDLFQYELAMRNPTSWSPRDYDERTIANAIADVRYYFRTDKDDLELPFGYSYIGEVDNAKEKRDAITRDIMKDQGSELNVPQLLYLGEKYKDVNYYFRNDFALPMGFMYDRYIGESDIDGLAYNKKENVMLDAAVIADEFKDEAKGDEMARPFDEEQVPYIIFPEETTAAISPDGKFIVTDNSQQVTLLLEKPVKNAELFVEINNMTFERTLEKDLYFGDDKIYDPYGIYNPAEYERFSPRQKYDIIKESLMTKEPETTIAVKDNLDRKKGVEIFSPYNKNYCAREAVALNLCYSEEEVNKVIIDLQGPGVYSVDSINIYGRRMDDYPERIAALNDNVLENEKIENDRITGDINALNDGLLYLSVPWSAGWSVYVDGVQETLIRTNYLYSAVPVGKGYHSIEMRYYTPYLRAGEVVCVIGFIVFIVWMTFIIKRGKNENESAE